MSFNPSKETRPAVAVLEYTDKLMHRFRWINHIWSRYRTTGHGMLIMLQEENFSFLDGIKDLDLNARNEILVISLRPGVDQAKVRFLLNELAEAVGETISLYEKKEHDYAQMDYEGYYLARKESLEDSLFHEWESSRIQSLRNQLDNLAWYKENWFAEIDSYAKSVRTFISRFEEDADQANPEVNVDARLPVPTVAIMHVYLGKGGYLTLTPTNKSKIAKQYSCSPKSLWNDFVKYGNDANRLNLPANKKSANTLIKHVTEVQSLLSERFKRASDLAAIDLKSLLRQAVRENLLIEKCRKNIVTGYNRLALFCGNTPIIPLVFQTRHMVIQNPFELIIERLNAIQTKVGDIDTIVRTGNVPPTRKSSKKKSSGKPDREAPLSISEEKEVANG